LLGTYCGSNASTEIMVLSSTNSLYIVSNSGSYARNPKNTFTFHAQYNAKGLYSCICNKLIILSWPYTR
jgi:hypothetical protein